ncbi:acetate kinase [Paenibacillus popilliae ATCC 14706]|uniref:Acetate kinase n=1 Tax=Paenibacillus popilliae ATCC 14706 TaxID=1212764 RepID=M9LQN5_PAEPP|nr:acetate kinase [Paenibacillus popilliae ATCC 14706]
MNEYLKQVDNQMEEKQGDLRELRKRIEENDMEAFITIVKLLLDERLDETIPLYFKMSGFTLSEEQKVCRTPDLSCGYDQRRVRNAIISVCIAHLLRGWRRRTRLSRTSRQP